MCERLWNVLDELGSKQSRRLACDVKRLLQHIDNTVVRECAGVTLDDDGRLVARLVGLLRLAVAPALPCRRLALELADLIANLTIARTA